MSTIVKQVAGDVDRLSSSGPAAELGAVEQWIVDGVTVFKVPSAQRTAYVQTYATTTHTVPTATAAAVATDAATNSTPYGFTQAQADAAIAAINALVADSLVNRKLLNSLIDDVQALSVAG